MRARRMVILPGESPQQPLQRTLDALAQGAQVVQNLPPEGSGGPLDERSVSWT